MRVTVDSGTAFPDGAKASAHLVAPDLTAVDVPLDRVSATSFAGDVPIGPAGTYAIGAQVSSSSGASITQVRTLVSQSYPPEYQQGPPATDAMLRLSKLSGGRGAIEPAKAFDAAGLPVGHGTRSVAVLLLLLAALLWPLDVALRRIALGGAGVVAMKNVLARARQFEWRSFKPRLRSRAPAGHGNGHGNGRGGGKGDGSTEGAAEGEEEPVYGPRQPVAKEIGTVSELLEKRQRRQSRRR
jgi:hypothetical protein